MYYQQDDRWKNIIMTYPKGQGYPDTIGEWGCVITSLSNITAMSGLLEKQNPAILNETIRINNAYMGLDNSKTKMSIYSNFMWHKLSTVFGRNVNVINDYQGSLYYSSNRFYIARIEKHLKSGGCIGHYINLLEQLNNDEFKCYDVWDGKEIYIDRKAITKIIAIIL